MPGVLSLAVMAAAMVSLGIATGFERRYGVLKRLGFDAAVARRAARREDRDRAALEVVQVVLIVVVGIALGWDATGRHRSPRSGCCSSARSRSPGIGLLMAGTLRAEANLAAANGLFLVLLFLGGMAYPLDEAARPRSQDFAKLLPAAALSDTVRAVLSTQPFPTGELVVLSCGRSPRRCRGPLVPLGGVTTVMVTYRLAQCNVALLRAPLDSPDLADFVAALEPIHRALPTERRWLRVATADRRPCRPVRCGITPVSIDVARQADYGASTCFDRAA